MAARFMSLVRNPVLWWSMVVVWFIALFIVSSMSHLPPGPQIVNFDKIEHTVFYSLGAACFYLARRFARGPASPLAACLGTVVFCMAVGAFDEWHQSFTPGRSGNDPYDWMADTLGGFVGALIGTVTYRVFAARTSSKPG